MHPSSKFVYLDGKLRESDQIRSEEESRNVHAIDLFAELLPDAATAPNPEEVAGGYVYATGEAGVYEVRFAPGSRAALEDEAFAALEQAQQGRRLVRGQPLW
jgi:hypothetical protein